MRWVGAPGGTAWRRHPLRLAFGRHCSFRPKAIAALDLAGIAWDMAVETDSDRTIEATVSADLAVHTMIDGTEPSFLEPIAHGGALPELPSQRINLFGADSGAGKVVRDLAAMLRYAFSSLPTPRSL